jgi:hypothetical protein
MEIPGYIQWKLAYLNHLREGVFLDTFLNATLLKFPDSVWENIKKKGTGRELKITINHIISMEKQRSSLAL